MNGPAILTVIAFAFLWFVVRLMRVDHEVQSRRFPGAKIPAENSRQAETGWEIGAANR